MDRQDLLELRELEHSMMVPERDKEIRMQKPRRPRTLNPNRLEPSASPAFSFSESPRRKLMQTLQKTHVGRMFESPTGGIENYAFTADGGSPNHGSRSARQTDTETETEAESLAGSVRSKEDYLAITMPEPDPSLTPGPKSFLGKWTKAARNFLKAGSQSMSVEDPESGPASLELKGQASPGEKERLKRAELIEMKKPIQIDLPKRSNRLQSLEGQSGSSPGTSSKRDLRRKELSGAVRKLFGITVHGTDFLPRDPSVFHPVVRVTLMTQTGAYLTRTEEVELSSRKAQKETTKDKGKTRGSSSAKAEGVWLKGSSVLPVMTQPFELGQRRNIAAPAWNELLLFEEPYSRFVEPGADLLILFEVMDFLPMTAAGVTKKKRPYHGSELGWYKIAWAFLKPLGANGARNVNRKLRLQLFKPEALSKTQFENGPEVYSWWKFGRRVKLNACTLYVTLRGILPPASINKTASIRALLSMRKEHLTQAILDSQVDQEQKKKNETFELTAKQSLMDIPAIPEWSRLEGQTCKVPNKVLKSLPSSQIAALNLIVSGNVHVLKFSQCGLKLAAGLDTEELHTVLIFEIPSGQLLRNLRGHHGLIYDLDWKGLDEVNGTASYYLASASADYTVLIWYLQGPSAVAYLIKTLLHPSFVYTVQFHPMSKLVVATGCFDYIIRIWNTKARPSSAGTDQFAPSQESRPIVLLDRHTSFVNCLTFNLDGSLFFSGDGSGALFKWCQGTQENGGQAWIVEKDVQLSEGGKCPINNLVVHPGGTQILAHIRDSRLKILDIQTLLVLHVLTGLHNDKLQVRSCFSPCGNLVLSGSEDSTLCVWESDTARILQLITPPDHPNSVVSSVAYHPFDHYVAIGLTSAISEPSPVMLYTYVPPQVPQLATIAALKSRLKRARRPIEVETRPSLVLKRPALDSIPSTDSASKFKSILRKLDEVKVTKSRSPRAPPASMTHVVEQLMQEGPKAGTRLSSDSDSPNSEINIISERPSSLKSIGKAGPDSGAEWPRRPASASARERPRSASARERRREVGPPETVPASPGLEVQPLARNEPKDEETLVQPIPKRRGSKEVTKSASESTPKAQQSRRKPRPSTPKQAKIVEEDLGPRAPQDAPQREAPSSDSNIGNTKRRERRERMNRRYEINSSPNNTNVQE